MGAPGRGRRRGLRNQQHPWSGQVPWGSLDTNSSQNLCSYMETTCWWVCLKSKGQAIFAWMPKPHRRAYSVLSLILESQHPISSRGCYLKTWTIHGHFLSLLLAQVFSVLRILSNFSLQLSYLLSICCRLWWYLTLVTSAGNPAMH